MTLTFDSFYTEHQRALQEENGTGKLAVKAMEQIVFDSIDEIRGGFIESRDFFFLSSVDEKGRPTVSYKGGPVGVCHVVDPVTLAFPVYDGNGMWLSLGNIAATSKVGLLFIDFETPNRVRVQGDATASVDDPLRARYPASKMIVRVSVESIFVNCGRYIHKHTRLSTSPHVPNAKGEQPHPAWKRLASVQDALTEEDQARTRAEGGTLTQEEYVSKVMAGES